LNNYTLIIQQLYNIEATADLAAIAHNMTVLEMIKV